MINKKPAAKLIKELTVKLNAYSHQYYNDGESAVSDNEFDLTLEQLAGLEKLYPDLQAIDSPTLRVGPETVGEFNKVIHDSPMLSLSKVYDKDALVLWMTKLEKKIKRAKLLYMQARVARLKRWHAQCLMCHMCEKSKMLLIGD